MGSLPVVLLVLIVDLHRARRDQSVDHESGLQGLTWPIQADLTPPAWRAERGVRGGLGRQQLPDLAQLAEKELQQFEQQFEQLPRRNQQPKLALWDESWNPLVSELREFGFDDAQDAKAALTESNGDVKAAVKLLMAKERQHHQ